ncbi:MAG: Nucleotidyltransferase [Thermoanaerobaculia bacterium]|jgi:hypothetical protein|nr:Nucleotidyltransferase [Thermoanaerobaculia bacterium]
MSNIETCNDDGQGYLLKESQLTAVLTRERSCAVRVPVPERFAIHKLIVSALRWAMDNPALSPLRAMNCRAARSNTSAERSPPYAQRWKSASAGMGRA